MYRLNKTGQINCKSAADISSSRLGIGFEKLDRDAFDPTKAYDKLSKIGVKWVRIQSGWQKTEKEKGIYNFAWLDEVVDNIIARDMIPWMCVCYGNKLYGGMAEEVFGAVGCPPIHTEEQKNAWKNYCKALTEHYRGRVRHFEIWNEPNGAHCWKHGVSVKELGAFTIATSDALKEGNPDAYIIGGALSTVEIGFIDSLFKTGIAEYIDAFSFHAYLFDDTRLKPFIKTLRALIDRYNPAIEIIQGESGSQSRPYGNGAVKVGAWTPKKQCKQMLRHLVTDLGMGCKFASYFSCMDMVEALHGKVGDVASYTDFGYFGVLGAEFDEEGHAIGEYTPKPSYYALSNLASLLHGNITAMDLPHLVKNDTAPHTGNFSTVSQRDLESYGFRLDNGSYALAYWYPSNFMTTDFEGAVTMTVAEHSEVHLVDPMDGTIYEIPASIMKNDPYGAIDLIQLPIRDYPLFLVLGEMEK